MRGVRRAGGVEPGEGRARVLVLRHRNALYRRRGHGRARRARSGEGAARDSGQRPRVARREAHGAVPELQGGLGVRRRADGAELRVLRVAGADRLPGDQGADPSAGHSALRDRPGARARTDARLVPRALARAEQSGGEGARRSRPRRLHPVLDVRCARRLSVGGGSRPLLLHDRDISGQQRTKADPAGPSRAPGTSVRGSASFL